MPARFQLTVDANDPDLLARFWAEALGYELQEPPDGFETWADYWRSVGVPDDEVDAGYDSIVDPTGASPRFWFQRVPESKAIKNRMHVDIGVGGGRDVPIERRKALIDAEADRLVLLGASILRVNAPAGVDHYAVAMADPEGNEFDIN